jgi:predicted dehydrogenase
MRTAIVGCGFVADLYMLTLCDHPAIELIGVMDRDLTRASRFAVHHGVRHYRSLQELLDEKHVELVLNLTNPRSHFAVSEACLRAGKHVYSEKPLAMSTTEAEQLVGLAEGRGLSLSCGPSRILGETAQTMWKAVRDGIVGKPLLAYAEMDDGLVHKMPYKHWVSTSGAPWPYKDEFETGCTLEHAGYSLTWLATFFGPAQSVSAFSTVVIPNKQTDVPLDVQAPDFSVACIRYASGVVARLTCSIIAPADHSIRVFGEQGTLSIDDCWKPRTPVYVRRRIKVAGRSLMMPFRRALPFQGAPGMRKQSRGLKKVDFCLGPLELIASIQERRPCRLSAHFCLHITETALAIHDALDRGTNLEIRSTFDPPAPMPWAK